MNDEIVEPSNCERSNLVIQGEWRCYEQEGGYADPSLQIDATGIGAAVDEWLGLESENGESGIILRVTFEVMESMT